MPPPPPKRTVIRALERLILGEREAGSQCGLLREDDLHALVYAAMAETLAREGGGGKWWRGGGRGR